VALHEMPTASRAVCRPDHDMGMELWFAVLERNVARERKYLDLFIHGYVLVFLLFPFEIAESDVPKGPDSCEVASAEPVLPGELDEARYDLIPRLEDQGECLGAVPAQGFELHGPLRDSLVQIRLVFVPLAAAFSRAPA